MIFDDEFDELAALAYQTVFRILGSRSEAQEVAQDTMIKAYPVAQSSTTPATVGVSSRRERVAGNCAATPTPSPGRGAPRGVRPEVADRVDLQRLLGSLSGRQRDVVTLRYLAAMSEADVADELGISVGTVKTHASCGVETLRHHLIASTSADEPSEPISMTARSTPMFEHLSDPNPPILDDNFHDSVIATAQSRQRRTRRAVGGIALVPLLALGGFGVYIRGQGHELDQNHRRRAHPGSTGATGWLRPSDSRLGR